jgi:hypothetical protein
VWTVAQLRAALDGIPDDARVRVECSMDGDPDTTEAQVVFAAANDPTLWYPDTRTHEPPRITSDGWLTLEADFPPDEYTRGPR